MTEFWIIAGLMSVIALGFMAWPIWRARDANGNWPIAGLVAAALLVPSAIFIYRNVSNWDGTGGTAGPTTTAEAEQFALVDRLAERMQENPDDVEGWVLLGRSYLTLQQFVPARQAFMQAWNRTPNPDNSLKLGLGIAMVHSDRSSLDSDGGRLIEEVLASDSTNQQALWYGGMVAFEQGRTDVARDRWTRLLAMNPPPQVAQALQQQIAMLGDLGPGSSAPFAGGAANGSPSGNAAASAADATTITLRLALGDEFSAADFGANARLFIFARAQAGGPPLAVIPAAVSDLPGEFTLSDSNVMIQGNVLSNFDELRLVARISRGGTPTEQPGDVYAETLYNAGQEGIVELTLNQVVQ